MKMLNFKNEDIFCNFFVLFNGFKVRLFKLTTLIEKFNFEYTYIQFYKKLSISKCGTNCASECPKQGFSGIDIILSNLNIK